MFVIGCHRTFSVGQRQTTMTMVRSPVEICLGTRSSQAPKSRPLPNTSPVPIAATVALEMMGPMPGTVINRYVVLLQRSAGYGVKAIDADTIGKIGLGYACFCELND